MRKFVYKQYKKFRGCTIHETTMLNHFINKFPYVYQYIILQFPISNINLKTKDFDLNILRDKKFIYSSRVDAIFINNDIFTLVEIKRTATLLSLLQISYYYNLMKANFPNKKYSKLIVLCQRFNPIAIKHADFLNIILIQLSGNPDDEPNFLTFGPEHFNVPV